MTQAGLAEYMAVDWRLWAAIYAPAKTPAAARDRLYAACNAAVRAEKTKETFGVYAMEPMTDYTPERLSAFQEEHPSGTDLQVSGMEVVPQAAPGQQCEAPLMRGVAPEESAQ